MYPHNTFDPSATTNSEFSIDFYLNPRYKPEVGEEYKAGTIAQISGSFALSIITGSSKDESGQSDKFRLQLQLGTVASHLAPSTATGSYVFKSDDNSLSYNCWHHVAVRWSRSSGSALGYGSFVVDGTEVGEFSASFVFFNCPNSSVILGNFYEGTSSFSMVADYSSDFPSTFSHPLRSEINNVKIWNKYLTDSEIKNYQSNSVGSLIPERLVFYVPVLFTSQSYHKVMGSYPEILKDLGTSKSSLDLDFVTRRAGSSPYNSLLRSNTGELEVNVENYVRDFVSRVYPRLYNLTGSENSVAGQSLYNQTKFKKRNLTILPCDNGKLQPDYGTLVSGTLEQNPSLTGSPHGRFVNDFGILDLSLVSLKDVVPGGASGEIDTDSDGIADEYFYPAAPVGVPTSFLSTRDTSSDAVVFFDSSNLFYGSRIHPGSLTLVDPSLFGSDGEISITLKDNGFGGLYRADALTPHATWAGVGTVLYDEGITVIKSPMLAQFGTSSFTMEMRGERPVHVMQIAVPCPAGQINSSSNPTFQPLTASDVPSETSIGAVIITGINFHDDNLNVVARSQLAQPIIKRSEDRFLFRTKLDW